MMVVVVWVKGPRPGPILRIFTPGPRLFTPRAQLFVNLDFTVHSLAQIGLHATLQRVGAVARETAVLHNHIGQHGALNKANGGFIVVSFVLF